MRAKGTHWLRQRRSNVAISSPSAQLDFSLINGDCDGDNEVTLVDFGQLAVSFGKSLGDAGFNANADLDGDAEVTLVDLGILNTSFGLAGDE